MAASLKLTCLLLAFMVVAAPLAANAAITCGMVASKLFPCLNYLTKGGNIPPGCCSGVQSLNTLAKSTPDRQQACRCLQSTARGIRDLKANLAAGLPRACKVNIPYSISLSTNCNNVK